MNLDVINIVMIEFLMIMLLGQCLIHYILMSLLIYKNNIFYNEFKDYTILQIFLIILNQ
jgi:hypothetical protein